MRRTRVLLTLAALALVAAACSTGTQAPSGPPGVENFGKTQSPPAQGTAGGSVAPILDFSAPQLDGGEVNGADYSGKDVALWFWAPW